MKNRKQWGECDCGKWGEVPKEFNESKHFLKCPVCKSLMYLTIFNPLEVMRKESDKIIPLVVKQNDKEIKGTKSN